MASFNDLRVGGNQVADFIINYGGDAKSWYRIWNSGWKECGGRLESDAAEMKTVTFPITFSELPYLSVTFMYGSDGTALYQYVSPRDVSVTGFRINGYVTVCQGHAWRAEGF